MRYLDPKRHIRHPSAVCLLGDVLVLTPKRIAAISRTAVRLRPSSAAHGLARPVRLSMQLWSRSIAATTRELQRH
jgi:hypothetical protein